jgi:hypothetical protein
MTIRKTIPAAATKSDVELRDANLTGRRFVAALALSAALSLSCSVDAHRAIACTFVYGGESTVVPVPETGDPYQVEGQDIGSRFHVKPVLHAGTPDGRLLEVYTFGRYDQGNVILHELKLGLDGPLPVSGGRYGLTGRQFVYEKDARELEYWCGLAAN